MSHIDPFGRGIREFEYQRNAYLNSLIEADQEDAQNYRLDNRWQDVNPFPYVLHEYLMPHQVKALDRIQERYDRAVQTHELHIQFGTCSTWCRFHPRYGRILKREQEKAELAKVTRDLARRRRLNPYPEKTLWGNSAPE